MILGIALLWLNTVGDKRIADTYGVRRTLLPPPEQPMP